jgi:hypothetical protein
VYDVPNLQRSTLAIRTLVAVFVIENDPNPHEFYGCSIRERIRNDKR